MGNNKEGEITRTNRDGESGGVSEDMKVGMMNYMLLLESITLQITVADPRRGWKT